ncbi:MAG: cytochrome c3 family protein [Thermodesulfobacteriota bacterium]
MKPKLIRLAALAVAAFIAAGPGAARAGSIVTTRHNLSVSGPGDIKAESESRICIFCHTPHKGRTDVSYLWNRRDSTTSYTIYHSTTLAGPAPGQPTGASKLCLSCHDGTIALGAVTSRTTEIPFSGGIRFIPAGRASRLSTDLSDDHPVSLYYQSSYASAPFRFRPEESFPPEVALDPYGRLQCTACHDPHDDANGNFLVMSNRYSDLCVACHAEQGWDGSSHATSSAAWNRVAPNPWPESEYGTVAENGCQSCHTPHGAGGKQRLLKYAYEEDNCLTCHNGNVATANIGRQITKLYSHSVQRYTGVHDPTENYATGSVPRHVECMDCHNAHQANANPGGALAGVAGLSGPVTQQNVQDLCYKCHSGANNVADSLPVTRQLDQLDVKKQFDPANPSFHPVGSPGKNPDVPSLIAPLTANSVITCGDCHASNETGAPPGPHGSDYQFILSKNYSIRDNQSESSFNYELCYKCHSRSSILSESGSFRYHRRHIVEERTACSACHAPHGISASQGNSTNNSHLINFDLSVVRPNSSGQLYFEDRGRFHGACYLSCHGDGHRPETY